MIKILFLSVFLSAHLCALNESDARVDSNNGTYESIIEIDDNSCYVLCYRFDLWTENEKYLPYGLRLADIKDYGIEENTKKEDIEPIICVDNVFAYMPFNKIYVKEMDYFRYIPYCSDVMYLNSNIAYSNHDDLVYEENYDSSSEESSSEETKEDSMELDYQGRDKRAKELGFKNQAEQICDFCSRIEWNPPESPK
jgi:hypothetical protein